MRRVLLWFALIIALGAAAGAGLVYWRFGGGVPYPDLTAAPQLGPGALEAAVTFGRPVGNAAVAADGRVFFAVHPESRPEPPFLHVAEGGDIRPFPDAAAQGLFETPLGLAIDRQDRLWVIDPGGHGFGTPKLVAFDIDTGAVVHEHAFADDIAPWGSFPQDLQVDPPGAIRLYRRCRFLADAPGVDRL